ncbi:MAG: anhydro-N-acetylmuramic acid kinase [Chitinophagaceae bacterium]
MFYRVIGVMSGSSLDGLDIVCVEFHFQTGKWNFSIVKSECKPYPEEWTRKLASSTSLDAREYLLLDAAYGHYLGQEIRDFMEKNDLQYKVSLVSVHGHTSFHLPPMMTAQLGDGAAIAAEIGLPVITGLRSMDVALGGQGAPIVPMGEKLLFPGDAYYLNIGGIANISIQNPDSFLAFDVCPANKVLNMLSSDLGKPFDSEGSWATEGKIDEKLLSELNKLDYYSKAVPKSLSNDFGIEVVYPLIRNTKIDLKDALATYTEHIAIQVASVVEKYGVSSSQPTSNILVTGGGAKNQFLVKRIQYHLEPMRVQVDIPDAILIDYKEAIIMAFLGVLRWRDEFTVFPSVTGASKPSIGGAIWNGQS